MSCAGTSSCNCGCCAGISVQTPAAGNNRPGLPAINYRTGTWATFKDSMLARLSGSDFPALAGLKTRDNDDFSIALIDASAVILDILTFYQERLANESYLRTATQLRSLVELSRLIGYEPAPSVSSSVYLAFTLKATPGQAPNPSTPSITIPKGTQAQSVPAQGQKPQIFETSADIQAKADWNALPVLASEPWVPANGAVSVYLQGTATQLQPGDLVLIVGDERLNNASSNQWDIRVVTSVHPDTKNDRTLVSWSEGLGHGVSLPAQGHVRFFAFRQRAALFGFNAVNPLMLAKDTITALGTQLGSNNDWVFLVHQLDQNALVDLDAVYPKIVSPGWIGLIMPDGTNDRSPSGLVSLYQVETVTSISRSDFSVSAKISRVKTDSSLGLAACYNATRATSVLAQSEEIAIASQPLTYPLYGTFLDLNDLRPDLVGAKVVAVSGKRQKIAVKAGIKNLKFVPDDGSAPLILNPGDELTITDPLPLPMNTDGTLPDWSAGFLLVRLSVEDSSGRSGPVISAGLIKSPLLSDFTLAASGKKDPDVSEYALVSSVSTVSIGLNGPSHTRIRLQSNLLNCYDRNLTVVNANVGLATNGQTVSEVLGNGAASVSNQRFALKQTPLTFVQAPTPTGRQSTLEVRANAVAWTEVPSLYQHGSSEQVYSTLNQPEGNTSILFGDGTEGATLPTGQNNVVANFRIGSGASGNVAQGSISILVDRPLGVSGVTNPLDATGGQDAQSIDDVRINAPQTVLTLGRAVSITDYQDYASTFAGIAKAHAIWIPSGPGRGVFLTVAGVGGSALPQGNPTLNNLVTSLKSYGNPLIPITARSFLETIFGFSADLKYDPAYDAKAVKAQVMTALTQAYSFAARTFGQGTSGDEIAAFIQAVPGITAVNVTKIFTVATSAAGDLAGTGTFTVAKLNKWLAQQVSVPRVASGSDARICAYLPVADPHSVPLPAEILVLDPDPKSVVLGVMA